MVFVLRLRALVVGLPRLVAETLVGHLRPAPLSGDVSWWGIDIGDGEFHVVPQGDAVEHECFDGCVCGPTVEPIERGDGSMGWLYVHHSLDGRELNES